MINKKIPRIKTNIEKSSTKIKKVKKSGDKHPIPVVGIGASAGGIEAITQLFSNLPADTGFAFAVILHLDPIYVSKLTEILSRATSMPIFEMKNGMALKQNHVFVIPPSFDAALNSNSKFKLTPRSTNKTLHLPIDLFFNSLADTRKNKSIGIILSGSGSDGTLGIQAIKAEGGITIAQKTSSAKYSSMPKSAIKSGAVDLILLTKDMGTEIQRMASHPYIQKLENLPDVKEADATEFADLPREMNQALGQIITAIRKVKHLDFSQYKIGTINRRIKRRMLLAKINSLKNYAQFVSQHPTEAKALSNDFLITITRFFRDNDVFEGLKKYVLPTLLKKIPKDNTIRVWIPGCATGEEAYSLAITLIEFFESKKVPVHIRIFATDICESALKQARTGFFPDGISQTVSKKRLDRFFEKVSGGFCIRKAVRETCVFSYHDVTRDPPFAKIDLVSCRNLLIYFNSELQKNVIPIFHYALKPDGFLLLGRSESLVGFQNLFTFKDKKYRVYIKKESLERKPLPFTLTPFSNNSTRQMQSEIFAENKLNIQKEADRYILEKYAPPCVLVNSNMDIITTRGNISFYLNLSDGHPSLNIMKMKNLELGLEIRQVIQAVKKTGLPTEKKDLLVKGESGTRIINLKIEQLLTFHQYKEKYFLVEFEEIKKTRKQNKHTINYTNLVSTQTEDLHLQQQKNVIAERHYQSLVSQFETVEEELVSANEELQSSNEELQSTNEELETTKEELQSSNEELSTVNDELQIRNTEITKLNQALQNLLSSIDIPIVLVDEERDIRHFTPVASKILSLIPTDVGRPIADIKPKLQSVNLDRMIIEVMKTMDPQITEIQDFKNCWHRLVVRPYKTATNKTEGAVVALFNIDDLKRTTDKLKQASDEAWIIIRTMPVPLLLIDAELKIQLANLAFCKTFKVSAEETKGKLITKLGNGQWNLPALIRLINTSLSKNISFKDFEVNHKFPKIGFKSMLLNARSIALPGSKRKMVLLAIEDATVRKQKEYKKLYDKLTLALEAGQIGTFELDPQLDVFHCDDRMNEIYGVDSNSAIVTSSSWLDFVHPDDARKAQEKVQNFLDKETLLDIEFRIVRPKGEVRYLHVKAMVLSQDMKRKKKYIIGAAWDITSEQTLALELNEEKHKLIQILHERDQVNKELESFAYITSHDLKAPLRGIESLTTWIEEDTSNKLSDFSKQNLVLLRSRVGRMSNLIKGILIYTKAGRIDLDISTVSVYELLDEVIDAINPPKNITIKYSKNLPTIKTARIPLSQVFSNLISNAMKYSNRKDTHIEIDFKDEKKFYEFYVKDNGPGIKREYQEKIFQMFQTLQSKDEIESTGLGLSIVKKIVELNHGKVRLESKMGKGSTFYFTWPKN